MEAFMSYGEIGRSKHLEHLLYSQLEKLEPNLSANSRVHFGVDYGTPVEGKGGASFEVKIRVREPYQREIFVKKSNPDFYGAIRDTVNTTRKLLRRERAVERSQIRRTRLAVGSD